MKKKIGTNGIHTRKFKLTLAILICIFALISISAALSEKGEKGLWVASIEKNGDSVLFADHDDSQTEGGWIQLSGGKEIQLPQPLSFSYCGTNCLERAGTTVKLNPEEPNTRPDSDKEKNTELEFTYPYSTHPFYTENQKVTMDYNGPSAFKKQEVDIYLVKGLGVGSIEEAIDLANNKTISLEKVFSEGTNSYTKTRATLDKKGDLTKPLTFDSLEPGSYGILITLADDKDKKDKAEKEKYGMEKKVLSATCFEVVNYELKTDAVDTLDEGDNLDVKMCLKDAPANGEFTYGALLINKEAYKAEINVSSNGTRAGTDVFVNDIDLRDLGINSTNYESKLSKSELSNEIQTFIGQGNGTISIGEKKQDTLSLTTFDLLPGDYLLFTGAYEPGKGLVGIDQKELTICTKGTSPI
ncbi:TIGR04279 domain-containing protein [Methanosarcina sp. UBA5]|uniref:TIGR04279 domain-containing protein n=1 Tax=Methanosarcina sp. UBA5 TaxID=1915593 RepID=UPI0025E74657|nr:TIGR04279 domain-containing protein [Methanosarcina sp. UBA5]